MTHADQGAAASSLMDLIDDYAEMRHRAGHWTYNDKAREAREAVQKALEGCEEPLFWVRLCSDGSYEGLLHNGRIEAVRKRSGAWSPLFLRAAPAHDEATTSLQEQLHEAQSSLAFYKSRFEQLQTVQDRMRNPERTIVCDILANGHLLHGGDGQPDSIRYGQEAVLVDPERREATRRDESLADYWRSRVAGLVEEFTSDAQARYIADRVVSDLYDLPPRGITHPAALQHDSRTPAEATRDQLLQGLSKLKLRLHFMHWPAEAMWNSGTSEAPNWIPDWRYEIQLIEHLLHGRPITAAEKPSDTRPAHEVLPTQPAQDPLRALIAQHAALLEQNEYAYFELCYHRTTGWMAWITDKPMCMPPVVNADRKVLAQGQGETPDQACADAARAQIGN